MRHIDESIPKWLERISEIVGQWAKQIENVNFSFKISLKPILNFCKQLRLI